MSLQEILGVVGDAVSRRATVDSVVGAPLQVGDRTFLPVARIQYGFGGGDNLGVIGSGGGMEATPLGLIEISPTGVSFHDIPTATTGGSATGNPTIRQVRDGIHQADCGADLPPCWLLVNGSEAAIVNAPPQAALSTLLVQYAAQLQVQVRFILFTGCDYRHAGGLADLLRMFPQARVAAHRSVEHSPLFPPKPTEGEPESWRAHLPTDGAAVHHGFDEQVWSTSLENEPLFVVYAPKRAWTDQLVVFRGAIFTQAPSQTAVVPEDVAAGVGRSLSEVFSGPYHVHTTFHGAQATDGLDTALFS